MNLLRTLVGLALPLILLGCAPASGRPPRPALTGEPTLAPASGQATVTTLDLATYVDETSAIALDYPAGWLVVPNAAVGTRGSQALLLSPGSTAESLAPGGSRIAISTFEWDPRNDLPAYIAQRRTAWEASGFMILPGSLTSLSDGRPASDFYIEAPDGLLTYFLLTVNADQYLQVSGEGDLALVETISRTLRPLAAP